MSEVVSVHGIPPLSRETQQVIDRLRATAIGDMVTWEELEELTKRHRDTVRQMARNARVKLENEFKMHFRTCVTVGVERVDFTTVAREIVPTQRKRLGSAARRMARTTRNVILDEMNQDDRNQVLIHQTVAELTQLACANKSVKRLAADFAEHRALSPFTPREAAAKLFAG